MEELLVKAIPFIIPAILVASWMVNTGHTPKKKEPGSDSAGAGKKSTSASSPKDSLSNNDMTSP